MAVRHIASGTISFGLVSIPVKFYTATKSENLAFNFLHAKCGSRIKQQQFCPTCNMTVERSDLVRGYEFAKDQYVQIKDDELKSLEGEDSQVIEIVEFVPLEKVDPIYFEKTYYLGPDKGGEKAYRLLGEVMSKSSRVALAKFVMRGKESLVLIRAAQGGLMLHTMYFADEVRNFAEVEKGDSTAVKEAELNLARRLVEELTSDEFAPEQYKDEYRDRVLSYLNEKIEGKEITTAAPPPRRVQGIDLMEALKQSLAKEGARGKKIAGIGGAKRAGKEVDKPLNFEQFKSSMRETELEVSDTDLRKSFEGLSALRAKSELPWSVVRGKVRNLKEDLKRGTAQPSLLQEKRKTLKAARIPLTARDWERY
ncbi:MAG: Ku protein [Deltaproteobacteria bacterium]|nr:Ku protein [Deltaproteobacteria bacterium]